MDCIVEADNGFRLFGRKIAVPPGNPKESSPEILLVKETIGETGARTPSVSVNGSEEDQQTPSKKTSNPLPCPRCSSTDTKFCYFNNYNVNQPRHFCKKCQRYWTAGGSLRNVPVGAGRRKSKSPSSLQYREMVISDRHLLYPYDVRFRQPGCGAGAGVRKHAMEEAAEGCVFFPKTLRMEGPCKSPSTHHHHFSC